ncbi:MAG: hypothetical protein AAFN74_05860 [Myxococcota bacterium]
MLEFCLVTLAFASATVRTSTAGLPEALPPDPLIERPRAFELPPGRRSGVKTDIGVDARFGVDIGDSGQDPPYAFILLAKGTVRGAPTKPRSSQQDPAGWFATLSWGAQISGSGSATGPDDEAFLPWALGIDAGYAFRPAPGWLIRPSAGVSGQFEAIARADTPNIGATIETTLERRWAPRPRRAIAVQVRAVGRYNSSPYDPQTGRFNRAMCTMWGRAFLDCALTFGVRPGTLAAEGALTVVRYRWSAELWAGWLVAGQETEDGAEGSGDAPPLFDDGDWLWTGVRTRWAATEDVSLGATLATAGRFKDSDNNARAPFFASELARTSLVGHVGVRF